MSDGAGAAILAGGRGTRLAAVLDGLPKALAPVGGVPAVERQLAMLAAQGFRDVLLLVGHGQAAIRDRLGDGARFGLALRYAADDPPRGTAGALAAARALLAPRFAVLFADTLLDVDLPRALAWHAERRADLTLFAHPNDHPQDSDLIVADGDGRVTALLPCPHPPGLSARNLAAAAVYVMERDALPAADAPADIAKDLVPHLLAAGRRVYAYRTTEYVKDIGTPERLAAAERDLAAGRPAACRLDRKRPAVFLDRDGTLNIDTGWIDRPERMTLVHDAAAAVRRINQAGRLAVVVTNQPVIARGDCTVATLDAIHARLETLLGRDGAWVDEIRYCPHHPDGGMPGEVPELKVRCDCRKPAPGLLRQAAAMLPIDMAASCLIGDRPADVGAARAAGIPSLVVGSNGTQPPHAAAAAEADFAFDRIAPAAAFAVDALPAVIGCARNLGRDVQPGDWALVGGPAFAGKSTLARGLRFALRERGIAATIVSLDRWIRSAGARDEGTVEGRFDMPGLAGFLGRLAALDAAATLRLPRYDRRRRVSMADADPADFAPGDTLVFDGVIGFLLPALVRRARVRVFADAAPAVRRARFAADYAGRGFDPDAIARLFAAREQEEVNRLHTMIGLATAVVRSDPDDHQPDAA